MKHEVVILRLSEMEWVTEKPGGSVPGGVYAEGPRTWIVKFPGSDRARNEVLAARLYGLCGLRVPRLELVELTHGEVGVASLLDPTLRRPARLDGRLSGLLDGYVVDCWLANWDVVGLEYDNVLQDPDGNAVRVDVGGALLFRAQGVPKGDAFGGQALEIATMRMPHVNRQAANVFRDVGPMNVECGLRALAAVKPWDVEAAVASCGLPPFVAETLLERREWLLGLETPWKFVTH